VKIFLLTILMFVSFGFEVKAERISSGWFQIQEVHVTELGWVTVIPKTKVLAPICNMARLKEGESNQIKIGVDRSLTILMATMYSSREIRLDYDDNTRSCWVYKVYAR
jgi:hypothetical protein